MSQPLDEGRSGQTPDPTPLPLEHCLPGAVLRASREAQGLSVSDVAQVIRFSERQIDALECDDYTSFAGATLLRGFIRSYAKFLKIDAAPLLAALEPVAPVAVSDVRPPDNFGVAEQPGLAPSTKSRLLIGGLLVLVVLAVALRFMPSTGDSAPATPVPPARPAMQSAAPSTVNSINISAAPVTSVPPAAPTAEMPALASPPAASLAASPASVPAPAPVAASGLRIELTDRSWVEIRDATQKVVMSGEYPAGTRQNVAGKPPFHVWIGKAAGVRVFMGERNIDLQPFTRADVARLTVE
jgi:cytoskeleton protein RodZ